jgi:2-hydroxy-3-oxopropionate reductase
MSRKVGFIGLGVMGTPMAQHVGNRFPLIVYDVDAARMERLEGAERAAGVAEVGQKADVVLLSLPSSAVVREVTTGSGGLLEAMRPGGTVIDTSTTEPRVSREVAAALQERRIRFLDAPVSGGEGGARQATLAFMVGGPEEVLRECREVLEPMAGSIVRVGEVGMGEVAKLVNNLIVGATFVAVAEGFALGVKSGLDPQTLFEAIRGGWAASRVLEVSAPAMLKRDFTPGGTVDILWKDLGYAMAQAREEDVPLPVTAVVHEIFKAARASGRGPLSQPSLITLWEDILGIRVGAEKR